MRQPATSIEEEILSALRRISRAISLYSSYVQKAYGVTGPQLMVLRELERSGEVTVSTLAGQVSLSHATVTGILDRLERRQLLERVPAADDRRKRVVRLTAAGTDLLADAPPLLQSRFLDELRSLENWEQTQILSTLQRVSAMMSAEDLPAAPVLMAGEGDVAEWSNLGILTETDADDGG